MMLMNIMYAQRTAFSISGKVSLVVMNSLSFCVFKYLFFISEVS